MFPKPRPFHFEVEPGEREGSSLLNRKVQLAFVFVTLSQIFGAEPAYSRMAALDESTQWVRHTNEILAVSENGPPSSTSGRFARSLQHSQRKECAPGNFGEMR